MKKLSVKDMAYMALMAALMASCSWIQIPSAVPFTLQTFAVFLCLSLLGGAKGTMAILVYVLLGLVGVPVFSGFRGGPAALFGTTGGYIIGFLFSGLIYWLIVKPSRNKLWLRAAAMLTGLIVCYAFGTAWFMAVYANQKGAVTLSAALSWCVLPFILPDLLKLALALFLSERLRPAIK